VSKTSIEWTEETWNPIVGCSIVSPGCTNCYAMKTAARNEAMGISRYDGTTRVVNGNTVWTGKLAQAPESTLLQPLKRKKPTTYFVNSMGDLFHEDVPDEWIDRVFAVMALTPQHTYQVLTKRAQRMREYLNRKIDWSARLGATWTAINTNGRVDIAKATELNHRMTAGAMQWPLDNIWLGVSTERQQEYDERIPLLLQTPAAVRFISAEPLLGPINLQQALYVGCEGGWEWEGAKRQMIDWVIVGGESGPNARPMHPDWARSLRDQCHAAGAAYFFKQWGNWHTEFDRDNDDPDWRQPYSSYKEPNFQILNLAGGCGFHGERVHVMRYCSKKSAGRMLDGVEHNAMPKVQP
jgi:protein gp37